MSVTFHAPVPRATAKSSKNSHGEDMDIDEEVAQIQAKASMKDMAIHIVTPGEVITTDTAFMR